MSQPFNYDYYFSLALNEIKLIRNPHGTISELQSIGDFPVRNQQLINIGGDEFDKYSEIVVGAREITKRYIYNIITALFAEKATFCTIIPQHRDKYEAARRPLVFLDTKVNCLCLIREMSRGITWITEDHVPDDVKQLLADTNADSFKEIYLLHDYAYLQFVGHNNDSNDPGRGVNAYSFPWLFDTYFGTDEYKHFRNALEEFRRNVDAYLGYTITRSLNSSSLVNFKKITEHTIKKFRYSELLRKTITNNRGNAVYLKNRDEFLKICNQFLAGNAYRVLLGDHDFSESLITAEWLRHSMQKARAIDLTVIGTGYFKAVEQLLFDLTKLYEPDFSKDSTLGEFATFYRNNADSILRSDIHWSTRRFVYESIYEYTKLRNGYFHKHNIREFSKIETIRNETFFLIFLLLGSHQLNNSMLTDLGMQCYQSFDGFSQLCEYVDFHLSGAFCIETKDGHEFWASSDSKYRPKFSQYANQECACFVHNDTFELLVITRDNLPSRIWAGHMNLIPANTSTFDGHIFDGYTKEKLIFENGCFIGPSIVEESEFSF